MTFPRSLSTTLLCLWLLAAAAPAAGLPGLARAQPVSPGEAGVLAPGVGSCPTFSWAPAAGAVEQEILVFRVDAAGPLPGPEGPAPADRPELRRGLPPGASSWTPSAAACLQPGAGYAWIVGWGQAGGAWSWSEPLLFRVAAAAAVDAGAAPGSPPAGGKPPRPSSPAAGASAVTVGGAGEGRIAALPPAGPPVLAASLGAAAALRAEEPAVAGDTAGLVGSAASPGGAGVVAANVAAGGGADLLLDGSSQGLADTVVTQSALDRPSAADQVFDVRNSGAGGMTLTVDGVPVLAAPVEAGQIAAGAVGSAEIADGSIAAADLEPAAGLSDAQVTDQLTVDGGAIDASPVGATTASTGAFTDLSATGAVTLGGGASALTVAATNLALDALGELTLMGAIVSTGPLDLSPGTGMDINIGPASTLDVFVDGLRELQVSSSGNINTGPNSAGRRNLRVSRVENDGADLDLTLQAAGSGQVHVNDTLRLDAGETIANSGSAVSLGSSGSELTFELGAATPEISSATGDVAVTDTLLVDDVLRLAPVDSEGGGVSPLCDAAALGVLYYDEDEESLCVCAASAGVPGFVTVPAGGACD